ncbi:hypothetical protein C9374_005937 [Naegleria lovaniensis]|uniref:Uncharacterized protein n=1 Tax=Naegleria lovaniensis TaxID=51637 RepID=A0AA88GP09_NAELO|nr:uncharacterized protein C9374_005937 [Naegleria lovaniensis]KAG2381553.1 hypothetical protein C9374_005937 [Naegleria lovaniensis]
MLNFKLMTTTSSNSHDHHHFSKFSSSKSGIIYYLLLSCCLWLLLLWSCCFHDNHNVAVIQESSFGFVHGSITIHTVSITNILSPNLQFTACGSQNMYATPIVATFDAPDMQEGKLLLSSGDYSFTIYEDYFASSCPNGVSTLNNTVKINGQTVMNLKTSCQCFPNYVQTLQQVPIVSYVMLNSTGNTFTIDLNPFNAGVDQRMQKISVNFYKMALSDTIIDLTLGNVPNRFDLLSPASYVQVQSEPFTSTALTNMSTSFSSFVTVNNNAIDIAENVTLNISSSSTLTNRLFFDVTSIKKLNVTTGVANTIFPQLFYSNTSTQVSYQLVGVKLASDEQLQIFYTVQTIYEPTSNTKFYLTFSVDGAQSPQVYDASTSGNSISTTLNVYKTSKMESFFDQNNIGYSVFATVSDLAYFKHVPPVGAVDSKCWVQLNIFSESFNGLIHIFSSKTSKQYSIPISTSDFIATVSNTAFIVLPSDMIDCVSSPTDIYVRLETDFVTQKSFSVNIFKKTFLYINDETSSFSQFVNATSPNLQNEAYGAFVNSIGSRDNVLQSVYLNFTQFQSGTEVAFIQQYNNGISSGPLLQSNTKKIPLPVKTFLMPGTIIYVYPSCKTCVANLTISLPTEYSIPFRLNSDAGSSSRTTLPYQFKNDYGIYWTYVNVSLIAFKGNATIVVDVVITNLIKVPSKLTLLATQGTIPLLTTSGSNINAPNNARYFVTTVGNSQLYNSTSDCTQSRSATYATISLSVPATAGIWKFGLFIDPTVTKVGTQFAWSAKSSDFNTVIGGVGSLSTQRLYVNPVEIVSSLSFSCSLYTCYSNKPAQLLLKFDASTLALASRAFEIYVKMGSVPTLSNYDFKSPPMSTYNNLTSTFMVRYLFTNVGTFIVNDALGSYSLLTRERLDLKASTIAFVWIRPIYEMPPFASNSICSQSAGSTRATYLYWYDDATNAQADSSSTLDFANPILLNVTGNLTTGNTGKTMMIEFSVPGSYSSYTENYNPVVMVIDPNGQTALYSMRKSVITYTLSKTIYSSIRYFSTFSITSNLVENPLNTSVMILPLNGSYSLSSTFSSNVLAYIDKPAFNIVYYYPIYITIGVMVGVTLAVLIYFSLCYLLIWIYNLDYSIDTLSSSTTALNGLISLYDKVLKKRVSTCLFGTFYLICAMVLSAVLLGLMGSTMSGIDTALNSDPFNNDQDLSLASNRSYYACCKYEPSGTLTKFKNDPFYCVTPSSSYYYDYSTYDTYANLTINGIRYNSPMPTRAVNTENYGIILSFLDCPNMSVVYYPANIDSVNTYGITGFVLGGVFSCLCFIAFSALIVECMIEYGKETRSVFSAWMREHRSASVATHSTNSSHHTDDPLHREQAMMRAVDQRNNKSTTNATTTTTTGTKTGAPAPKSSSSGLHSPKSVSSEYENSSDEDVRSYDHVHVELSNVVRTTTGNNSTDHSSTTIPPDIKKPNVPVQPLEPPQPPQLASTTHQHRPPPTIDNYGHVPLGSMTVIQNNEVYGMQNAVNDANNNLVQVIPSAMYLPESVNYNNSNAMSYNNSQDYNQPAVEYNNLSNYNNNN